MIPFVNTVPVSRTRLTQGEPVGAGVPAGLVGEAFQPAAGTDRGKSFLQAGRYQFTGKLACKSDTVLMKWPTLGVCPKTGKATRDYGNSAGG